MSRQLVTVDATDADIACHHYEGSRQYEMEARAKIVAVLQEMEEWAVGALERKTPAGLLDAAELAEAIPNERRANYVIAIRLHMAIEQIVSANAVHLGEKHPKADMIIDALKVWANRAWAAAEPNAEFKLYSTG